MKKKYKFIHFVNNNQWNQNSSSIAGCWICKNNKSKTALGHVRYDSLWHQYCYFSTVPAVYSSGCLDDISDFLKQLN